MSDGKKHLFTPFRTNHWAQRILAVLLFLGPQAKKVRRTVWNWFFFFFFPFFPPVIDRVTKTEGETVSRYL